MQEVKEEPVDHQELIDNDVIIASYDIVRLENTKFKTFNVSGLSNILNQTKCYDISIRTDLKEFKISSKINDKLSVFCTKECQHNLKKKMFAVKLSRETGKAYFIPINSMHLITYLDEMNQSSNPIDSQNLIFEDCYKMPHPTRNKHDQLRVEMKNYLYKPLNCIISPEMVRKFMDQLFILPLKKSLHHTSSMVSTEKIDSSKRQETPIMDLINCPYWYLNNVNLCDINRIEIIDTKIEIFLRKVQIIRFEEILTIFQIDIPELLNILKNICYLIRGIWVIKSHLLYKFNIIHDSESTQKHLKKLIAAREFLLWFFATDKPIKKTEIYEKFKNINGFEEILKRITVSNTSNENIEFILSEDVCFISKYNNVAKKHHQKTKELLSSKHQDCLKILNSD